MSRENSITIEASDKAKPQAALKTRLASVLTYVFLVVTLFALFVPLDPRMPNRGLDASWEFAMNQAVARHMNFGTQIAFTYGPYASVATRIYDPATDLRMLVGSCVLAISYGLALVFLARGRGRYLTIGLLFFLATFPNTEIFLLSYSYLLAICWLTYLNRNQREGMIGPKWLPVAAAIVMLLTSGLLPLVKGSLLLPFTVVSLVPAALLFYRSRIGLGLLFLLLPVGSALMLWGVAGQPMGNLPAFLRCTAFLTAGYTEAMATSWLVLPASVGAGLVVVFIAVSGLLCLSIFRSQKLEPSSKWALGLLSAIFLFVVFKHGFVKADEVPTAFASLSVIAIILGFLVWDRYAVVAITIAVVLAAGTSVMSDTVLYKEVHEKFGMGVAWGGGRRTDVLKFCIDRAAGAYARSTYESTWSTYRDLWDGLRIRMGNSRQLEERFEAAKAAIRNSMPIPALQGSADVYSYDQSVLLATANQWDPRPVLQSYSVYTPELATMDEAHLRGAAAPDWVLFDLQTIDGRYPSLDDGASWPALLDNYELNSFAGPYALLQKRGLLQTRTQYASVNTQICNTGSTVSIPQQDGLLFAEVELKPTLAGRLLNTLFSPPQLQIKVGLADGSVKKFRVVSAMMKTEFLLSPMVSDTKDFAALMTKANQGAHLPRVQTISITPSYGGSLFWSKSFAITLKKYPTVGGDGIVGGR